MAFFLFDRVGEGKRRKLSYNPYNTYNTYNSYQCKYKKKEPLFQEALRWATRIRTWNDRTRICSVTITP